MMMKIIKFPLTLISYIWSTVYAIRRFKYLMKNSASESLAPPVISVGNIAFGGTGKTPFIIWLANFLKAENKDIIIATRGYRSKRENSGGLMTYPSNEKYSAKEFGDEPVLIGENIQVGRVIVGKERFKNLRRFLLDDEYNSVVLLDDGFQHLMLNRDLNIVLFDATLDLDSYYCPPRGYLREGVSSLKDADIIAIGRVDLVDKEKIAALEKFLSPHVQENTLFVHFKYQGEYLTNLQDKKASAESHKWYAFSGIASPHVFIESLNKIQCNIVGQKSFADHFEYTIEHLNELKAEARSLGAKLVCTEKDAVKLKELDASIEVYFLKIAVQFSRGEDEIKSAIKRVISY